MSAEIQPLPLIQCTAPLIISTAIILSDSKAQGREEEPALQEMDACYCLWDDSVFQSGPLCSNPMQSLSSAESVTASSIHHSVLVVGRCTTQLPGDRGNTCPALPGTLSSHRSFVSLCLGLNVRPQKTVKAALFLLFVICTQKLGKGAFPLPRSKGLVDRTPILLSCADHDQRQACMVLIST